MQLNRIIQHNVLKTPWPLPDNSVDCCVTSPPYWGLRNYGVDGQLGLEKTPEEFIEKMVAVFQEVKRVLKPEGTCWINIGDSYANGRIGRDDQQKFYNRTHGYKSKALESASRRSLPVGLKPKDLVGIPWMLAFALRSAGWYLRQDIIWHKPNPMPESVSDRCTKAHECIFLLSKSARYFYDQKAILEPVSPNTHARLSQDLQNQIGSARANGGKKSNGNMKAVSRKISDSGVGWGRLSNLSPDDIRNRPPRIKNNQSFDAAMAIMPDERNKRSVWTVATAPFKEAHFATFPEKLITPCILAGCPKDGIVLDPFIGAGTTGLVAMSHDRNFIGFELNPDYITIANKRLKQKFMWIIPSNLPLSSRSALEFLASKEDLNELAFNAVSLPTWKSKPSSLQTWLRAWKRVYWIPHLFGRMLKPSMHDRFVERIHGIIGGYPCPGESLAGLREGHLYKGFIWPAITKS
jgi:DNA modification methylase